MLGRATSRLPPAAPAAHPAQPSITQHLGVQVVVNVGGPDGGEEEQHLMRQKVHRHVKHRPGVGQRLRGDGEWWWGG